MYLDGMEKLDELDKLNELGEYHLIDFGLTEGIVWIGWKEQIEWDW